MIKKFTCGFCRKLKRAEFIGTRKGLRKHLKDEHGFKSELTNIEGNKGKIKQDWWIDKEFK